MATSPILSLEKGKTVYYISGDTYPYQHVIGAIGQYRGAKGYSVQLANYKEASKLVNDINNGIIAPKEFQTIKITIEKAKQDARVVVEMRAEADGTEAEGTEAEESVWVVSRLVGSKSTSDKFYITPHDKKTDASKNERLVIIADGKWQIKNETRDHSIRFE